MAESFQQMVQDLLNQAVDALNDKNNQYYLPKFLQTSKPCYDPYTQPATWNFNMTSSSVLAAAGTICKDIATNSQGTVCPSFSDKYMIDPSITPVLTLGGPNAGDFEVTGFSNAMIPQGGLTASGDGLPLTITAKIEFSTLSPVTNPVISGNFNLTQNCCCATPAAPNQCTAGSSTKYSGSGTFSTEVCGSASAVLTCVIKAVSCNHLTLSVTNIVLTAPTDKNSDPYLTTTVKITSIPSGADPQSYDNLAQNAFNDPDARTQIMAQINTVMNESGALDVVCTALETVMNNYIAANNLYPYNCASLELY